MSTNPALELAFNYVAHTDRHIFLTGKAGTGKTTFLHRVKKEVHKRMCVVAPTGVAAINAGAQTIHSQFSLPFGFLEPGRDVHQARKIANRKVDLLRNIDLLIIDEISMVRADVLDAIDQVLRKIRGNGKAFGGVQLLMIGDMHQLPPVVVREEEREVSRHYKTPYFFGSKVMARADAVTIPLTHIYRQSDGKFIDLLNKVRHNEIDNQLIARLNSRYRERPDEGAGQITLTSHNAAARRVNDRNLGKLTTKAHQFSAIISGEFPKSMYPNDKELTFKVGAQVMFNKNDNEGGRYYNGKLGEITAIEKQIITVVCPGEKPIEVTPVSWDNIKAALDETSGAPREKSAGLYTQHPLRLAWAITIHKSQGLTFDRVTIDAADSFSHGQVYVALSRCRTFEGITLRSRISRRSVKTDAVVTEHSKAAERNRPTEDDLAEDRRQFQITCLEHLFDFVAIEHQLTEIGRALTHPAIRIQCDGVNRFLKIKQSVRKEMVSIGRGFQPHLRQLRPTSVAPETDDKLQQRLKAAAEYYLRHLRGEMGNSINTFTFLCDNALDRSNIEEKLEDLQREFFVKRRLFELVSEGFTAEAYSMTQTMAVAEFNKSGKPPRSTVSSPKIVTPGGVEHEALFREMVEWRAARARDIDLPAYRVLGNKTLINLCAILPITADALLRVNGIGAKKQSIYGEELLAIIKRYTVKNDIPGNQFAQTRSAANATTFSQTLRLFKQGLTATDIADQRGLREETIYQHAIKFIREGALTPDAVLGADRHRQVVEYTIDKGLSDISLLFHQAKGKFGLGELRLVLTAKSIRETAVRLTA